MKSNTLNFEEKSTIDSANGIVVDNELVNTSSLNKDFASTDTFLKLVTNPLLINSLKDDIFKYLRKQNFEEIFEDTTLDNILVTTQLYQVNKDDDFLKTIVIEKCRFLNEDNKDPFWDKTSRKKYDNKNKIIKLYYLASLTGQDTYVEIIKKAIVNFIKQQAFSDEYLRGALLLSRTCDCFNDIKELLITQITEALKKPKNFSYFVLLSSIQEVPSLGLLNKDTAALAHDALKNETVSFSVLLQPLNKYIKEILNINDIDFLQSKHFREVMNNDNLSVDQINEVKLFLQNLDLNSILNATTLQQTLFDTNSFAFLEDKSINQKKLLIEKSHYQYDNLIRLYLLATHINDNEYAGRLQNKILEKINSVLSNNYGDRGFQCYLPACAKLAAATDCYDQANNILSRQIVRHLECSREPRPLDKILQDLHKHQLLTIAMCREIADCLNKSKSIQSDYTVTINSFVDKLLSVNKAPDDKPKLTNSLISVKNTSMFTTQFQDEVENQDTPNLQVSKKQSLS